MYLKIIETQDIPRVVQLAKNFHQFSPYNTNDFSEDKVKSICEAVIKSDKKDSIVILLMDDHGTPQGFIAGAASETPFGLDRMAVEIAWWVEEEFRGSRKSFELLLAYEDWAKRVKCNIVTMSMIQSFSPDKLKDVYQRLGYKQAEHSFVKEI